MSQSPANTAWGYRHPLALRPGDRVAVVAPASPFDAATFDAGLEVLARRYQPTYGPGLFACRRYLAGEDARRAAELDQALADPAVRGVFAARGGYGSLRLLTGLKAPAVPKPVVGFSDLTAVHLALQAAGWVTFHGPVVTQLATLPGEALERLFTLLEDADRPAPPLQGVPLHGGMAEGPLLGGNLSLVTRLLGTSLMPPMDGAILLLEDVGERPYRLDRMWTHLGLAGVLDRIGGLALGEFTGCDEPGADYGSAEVVADLVAETGLPCVSGLPIGHGAVNLAVPLGARVRLDGDAGILAFLEPAVEQRVLPGAPGRSPSRAPSELHDA